MIAVIQSRSIGALERRHPGIERYANEFAERGQRDGRIPYQVVILQLVDCSSAPHQLVRFFLHSATTEQRTQIHSRPRKPWRLFRRANDASANFRRIAPDHDELCIREPGGQLCHAIVIAGRLASPDGRTLLSRVLLGNRAKGAG